MSTTLKQAPDCSIPNPTLAWGGVFKVEKRQHVFVPSYFHRVRRWGKQAGKKEGKEI